MQSRKYWGIPIRIWILVREDGEGKENITLETTESCSSFVGNVESWDIRGLINAVIAPAPKTRLFYL